MNRSEEKDRARLVAAALILIFIISIITALPGNAYSVLSHEAVVDAAWSTHIVPLLRKRFPTATPEELRQAHAYAYGGAIIQDMGYYPYGNKFFSDLTHYVRSGDFVLALLHDAQDLNEYAFALGALSHCATDTDGHRLAVNRAVPLLYPELRKKWGAEVSFEDSPIAHVKTEFGFDVVEVAKGRYAPDAYRDFIGFEVAQPLLERAFRETYGLELNAVLEHESKAIGSYRHDVSKLIPKATRVAWQVKRKDIQQDVPGVTRRQFLYNMSRASFEKQWGRQYRYPSFGEKVLAFLFRLIPKVGPLKILTLRTPTPEAERLFQSSFNASLDQYRRQLQALGKGSIELPNQNLDVGKETPPGEYRLNDDTHAELLHRLAAQQFAGIPVALQAAIEQFYANPGAPDTTKRSAKRWSRVQSELAKMKSRSNLAADAEPR